MPRCFNLADLFEIVADAVPDRVAVVADDGVTQHRLTYRELEERSNQVAHHLQSVGVGAGDHVAILAYNRAEWIEAQIGVYKLRAVPINVNYRYVTDELAYVVADAQCVALVGERSLLARLNSQWEKLSSLRHVLVIEDGSADEVPDAVAYADSVAAASPERDFGPRSPDDRYVLYTGGTTGMPKGVVWRSEDIFFAAMGGGNVLGPPAESPEDVGRAASEGAPLITMVCPPLMHGAAQWLEWMVLASGSPLVLWTGRSFDPAQVLAVAEREKAQVILLVGDVMARPIADLLTAQPDKYDLSALLAIATGAAATSPDVKASLHAALPTLGLIMDALGGSETGTAAQAVGTAEDGATKFAPREDVAVLDYDLRPIPPGSDEIGTFARTGRIPIGYWNDEAKTAATFKVDADGRRWALQGDLAKVDADGTLLLYGRGSMVINTGGEKVFREEVEATLKAHPAVYDALVVGTPDPRLGNRIAAVVALSEGTTATPEELDAHCRKTLAGYKVPRSVQIVDQVQRSPAGKADYRWAKQVFEN